MKAGRLRIRQGDRTWDAAVSTDGRVDIAERRLAVTRGAGASWRVAEDERATSVHAVSDGDTVWVHADGQVFVFEVSGASEGRARSRTPAGAGLSAPMPATVRAVLVSAGDTVENGQTLVVLEAMKMELPLRAPRAGTVRAVMCQPGELVQPGVALVELS